MDRRIHRVEHYTPSVRVNVDFHFNSCSPPRLLCVALSFSMWLVRATVLSQRFSPPLSLALTLALYMCVFVYPHFIVRLKSIEMRMQSYNTITRHRFHMFGSQCARPNKMFSLFGSLVACYSLNRPHVRWNTRLARLIFGTLYRCHLTRANFARIAIELVGIESGDLIVFVSLASWCAVNTKVNRNHKLLSKEKSREKVVPCVFQPNITEIEFSGNEKKKILFNTKKREKKVGKKYSKMMPKSGVKYYLSIGLVLVATNGLCHARSGLYSEESPSSIRIEQCHQGCIKKVMNAKK